MRSSGRNGAGHIFVAAMVLMGDLYLYFLSFTSLHATSASEVPSGAPSHYLQ